MSVRQIGPEHMSCKDPDCSSGEFWITPEGLVICADDECFAEYGRLTEAPASEAGPTFEAAISELEASDAQR